MKKTVLIAFIGILFCSFSAFAQNSLHLHLQDTNNESLPFATILLKKSTDSSLVKGLNTDENGDFFKYFVNEDGNPTKQAHRLQKALFHEKQTLIENCLFGVDINPNSVKICRLRLWIELLKNAYYKNATELETLPNIDINIKNDDGDTREVIERMARLRLQKANLMGKKSFAEWKLQDQMAKTPAPAMDLLAKIAAPAVAKAKVEAEEKIKAEQEAEEVKN